MRAVAILFMGLFLYANLLAAGEPVTLGEAERLIQVLEDGDFDEREEAEAKLKTLGEAAREALQKAAQSHAVLEIRQTAREILKHLSLATLQFEVFDPYGKPWAGKKAKAHWPTSEGNPFHAHRESESAAAELTTDSNGRLLKDGLPAGPSYPTVDWTGASERLRRGSHPYLILQPGLNRRIVVLTPLGHIRGKVVDSETGAPLVDAQVGILDIRPADLGRPIEELIHEFMPNTDREDTNAKSTDEQGVFNIEDRVAGIYTLAVVGEDKEPVLIPHVRVEPGQVFELPAPVKLKAKAPKNSGALEIEVLDEQGQSVKHATVLCCAQPLAPLGREAEFRRRLYTMLQNEEMLDDRDSFSKQVDESGKIKLENLEPGRYRLLVRSPLGSTVVHREVQVDAGATANVKGLKPGSGGSIGGRVLDAAGKGLSSVQLFALPQDDPMAPRSTKQLFALYYWIVNSDGEISKHMPLLRHARSGPDGQFTFARVPAGAWMICAVLASEKPVVVFGIEVQDGKQAEQTIQTREPSAPPGVGRLAGRVFLENGKPASEAQVEIEFSRVHWSIETEADGSFEIEPDQDDGVPQKVRARLSSTLQSEVDLTVPGVKVDALEIRLKEQAYGRAKVTVRDGEGKLLPGALVWPEPSTAQLDDDDYDRDRFTRGTNAQGQAVFKGIAVGKRRFRTQLAGYFEAQSEPVEIKADTETEIALVLKSGLSVAGEVELPPGTDPATVVVMLESYEGCRSTGMEANGHFRFQLLSPADYLVYAIHPTLVSESAVRFELTEGRQEPCRLRMVQPAGLRLRFPKAYVGGFVKCCRSGDWQPLIPEYEKAEDSLEAAEFRTAEIGESGCIHEFDLGEGAYDLLVYPPEDSEYPHAFASAGILVKGLQIKTVPGGRLAWDKLPEIELQLPDTGSLKLKPEWTGAAIRPEDEDLCQIKLEVVSEQALAEYSWSVPEDVNDRQIPLLIGTPPADYEQSDAEILVVNGLPAGTYKINATFVRYGVLPHPTIPDRLGWGTQRLSKTLTLQTVEIHAGGVTELGRLKIEIPEAVLQKARELIRRSTEQEKSTRETAGFDQPIDTKP
ncbi:MAG: carboxypeptidase regulatory-like domain-containing protein [Planctomycetes bacterium]|nr:carboxypeptidase regulatory-like domain-containing protein [Planctomycetota bacterium]